MIRQPMTPAEADAAWRVFERECPFASLTSGQRSEARNVEVGGNPRSKHLYGMARDYETPTIELRDEALVVARRLGFWLKAYDWGLHTQGLPPGPVPEWWRDKYGRE